MQVTVECCFVGNTTYSFYIGDSYSVNPLTMLVGKLLMYYLGDHDPKVSKQRCREMDDEEVRHGADSKMLGVTGKITEIYCNNIIFIIVNTKSCTLSPII